MNGGYTLGIAQNSTESWAAIAIDGVVSDSFEIETDSETPIDEWIEEAVTQATEIVGESPAIVSVATEERRAHSEEIAEARQDLECIVTEAVIPRRRVTDSTNDPQPLEPELRATRAAEKYYI